MKELSFYSTNTTPYLGIVLAILSILPIVLIHTILKPKYSKEKNSKYGKNRTLLIINAILYIINIIVLIISKDSFNIKNANIWFGIMCFFYILYYELYIRYIIGGRQYKALYENFMFVKVPIFISMSMSLVFAGIWSKNIVLIIVSILFTITNSYTSYIRYKKISKN